MKTLLVVFLIALRRGCIVVDSRSGAHQMLIPRRSLCCPSRAWVSSLRARVYVNDAIFIIVELWWAYCS